MNEDKQPIGVIGVGWVGLVTATCFAELGHPVVALDIVEAKIEALRRGEAPIHEPGLDELLTRNAERLTFTTSMDEVLAGSRLLFCCVDTPPTYSGDADLSRVRAVVEKLPPGGEHALVMKSTVPSGTGAAIRRDKPDLAYVSCPEFLKEGSAVEDFMHPDRVVVGADPGSEWAANAVEDVYRPLGGELVRTDVASAEMIKLASNAFLATKISFINEIANVCEQTGADVTEVARGMGLDQRIGSSFLNAGIGYGGSCFAGDQEVWVRRGGEDPSRVPFDRLWSETRDRGDAFEVLSWMPGEPDVDWLPAAVVTARHHSGELLRIDVASGHSTLVTPDHPFLALDGKSPAAGITLARDLTQDHSLPTAEAGSSFDALGTHGYLFGTHGYPPEREGGAAVRDRVTRRAGVAWHEVVRVEAKPFRGTVYSLEVPKSHTIVVNDGLIAHNCFPKDVSALKQLAGNTGYHFQLLNAVIEVNELQKRRVIAKLEKHLGSLVDKKIALLGLAFKPNTDDMREASSLVLASRLEGEGASVSAYDPIAEDAASGLLPSVEMSDSAEAALAGADAAVLVTEWPEFAELDWAALAGNMANPLIVDGRNFLDADALRAAGFTYEGIGRPNGGR